MSDKNLSAFVNPAHRLKYPYKIFVKTKESESNANSTSKSATTSACHALTGDETKDIYESIIKEDQPDEKYVVHSNERKRSNIKTSWNTTTNKLSTLTKEKRKIQPVLSIKEILLAIENDNDDILNLAFDQGWEGKIINYKDQYGWTPLMIAACAGALKTFKILIEKGANINEKDKSGHNSLSLAMKNNRSEIINYIDSYNSGTLLKQEKTVETVSDVPESTVNSECKLCNQVIKSRRQMKQHLSSTVHLLNVERKEIKENGGNPKVHYGISQSNRGFQMMLSNGWDSNVGLGPSGKGKLYPVKTVLKLDKHGLGLLESNAAGSSKSSKKAKVTHFGPYDLSSVRNDKINKREESVKTLSKKELNKKKKMLKHHEIDFRRQFMMP